MALFRYKAISQQGKEEVGEIEADQKKQAIHLIQAKGLSPLFINERGSPDQEMPFVTRIHKGMFYSQKRGSWSQVISFTRKISDLTSAGMDIDQAVGVVKRYSSFGSFLGVIKKLSEDMHQGKSFADSLLHHKPLFPNYYINMIRAGEISGNLDVILRKLSNFIEKQENTKKTIHSELIYPVILVITMIISIIFLVTFVLPRFEDIFRNAEQDLPIMMQILLNLSDFLINYGLFIVIFIISVISIFFIKLKDDRFRLWVEQKIIQIPFLGSLLVRSEISRLSSTLGMLISGGATLLPSLDLVVSGLSNTALKTDFAKVREDVKHGRSLGDSLKFHIQIMPLFSQMVAVSEMTNRLDKTLIRFSEMLDRDVDHDIARFIAIFIPAITLSLAVIVAIIIGSILTAMLAANEVIY